MPHDYEDIFDLDDLDDEELRRLVHDQLAEYDALDIDSILIHVSNGVVRLTGRVGTEEERQIAEHVLTDVIGVERYANELLVDTVRRAEEPEATDEHLGHAAARGEDQLGGNDFLRTDPSADHLRTHPDSRLYGTRDLSRAIGEATPWNPPDTPTPEGMPGDTPDADTDTEAH